MRILVSNDDGYQAQGIAALAEALSAIAEVIVIAPERDRSGASNAITVNRPLHVHRAANGFHYVDGKPADCIHVGVSAFLSERPDLVVAGINHGANLGDDAIYSGTIAAAREAYQHGLPGLAVSLVGHGATHFKTAGAVARQVVERMRDNPPDARWLLSLNVPDVPLEALRGLRCTRLGRRHPATPATRVPREDAVAQYRVGSLGAPADCAPDTDFAAVAAGFASLTPLTVDLTQYDQLQMVSGWLL